MFETETTAAPITIELKPTDDLVVFNHDKFTKKVLPDTPYRSDFFSIIVLRKGEMKILYNLTEYIITDNSLLLLAPKSLYQFNYLSENLELTGMAFNNTFMMKADFILNAGSLVNLLSSDLKTSFLLKPDEVNIMFYLFSLLDKKAANSTLSTIDKKVLIHCFSTILYETASLFQRYNTAYKAKFTRKEELVLRFLKLLSIHFESERSVTFYAGLLHITPKYLTETAKEITGKTAGELIDLAVIMQAKILLKNPNLNIGQVSSSLNFSNQSFFGKFFKKHIGVSPIHYRSHL